MINRKIIFIIFSIFNILVCQNNSAHLWQGISTSIPDNLDAINLNPAGLGINRENQSGISIRQHPYSPENNVHMVISKRFSCGLGVENYYDGRFNTSWIH